MILAAATLARFSVIVILLVGILTIIGMVWKTVKAASSAVYLQLEATRDNTRAIKDLSTRVTSLERATH